MDGGREVGVVKIVAGRRRSRVMTVQTAGSPQALTFDWKPQPLAERLVHDVVDEVLARIPPAADFSGRLDAEAGGGFADLVDTIHLPPEDARLSALHDAGWEPLTEGGKEFHNPLGLFPRVSVRAETGVCVDLKVESVVDFLGAHAVDTVVIGPPGAA